MMAGSPPPPPWGWGRPQRIALAGLATALAASLGIAARPVAGPPRAGPPASMVLELNSAPAAALLALPGLGPARVERILAARAERPFESIDDLARRVKGVGPATIEGLRPFVRVAPAEPDAPR